MSRSHHLCLVPGPFHHPEGTPHSHGCSLPNSTSPRPWPPVSCLVSKGWPVLDISTQVASCTPQPFMAGFIAPCFQIHCVRRESVRTRSPVLRAPPHRPPQWLCSSPPPGIRRQWMTSPASSASGSRWPSWRRSSCTRRSPPSCCPGCPAGQPPTPAGTAPSAAASGAAARPPRSWVGVWAGGVRGVLAGSWAEGQCHGNQG